MTFCEFVEFENASDIKHEFHDGEVLAMSGASIPHNRVQRNIYLTIGNRIRGGPCEFFASDMRVVAERINRSFYPDATIVCEEIRQHADDPRSLTNPHVIIEVLSESTEAYDRGEKFRYFKLIDSLDEYVLVSQSAPVIESFLRQDDGTWSQQTWEGLDAVARLRCLDVDLPLAEVYERVDFEAVG